MLFISDKELYRVLKMTDKYYGINKYVLSMVHPEVWSISDISAGESISIQSHDSYESFTRLLLYNLNTEGYLEKFNDIDTIAKALYIVSKYLWHIRYIRNEEDVTEDDEYIPDINAYIKDLTIDDMLRLYIGCRQALEKDNDYLGTIELHIPKLQKTIKLSNWNNWIIHHLVKYSSEHLPEIECSLDKADELWKKRHPIGHKEDGDYKSVVYGTYNLLKEFYNGDKGTMIPNCIRKITANFIELHAALLGKFPTDITMDNIGATIKSCLKKEPQLLYNKMCSEELNSSGRAEYIDIY